VKNKKGRNNMHTTGSNPKAMSGKGPSKSKATTRKPMAKGKTVPASKAFDDMSAKTTVAQDKYRKDNSKHVNKDMDNKKAGKDRTASFKAVREEDQKAWEKNQKAKGKNADGSPLKKSKK